MYEAVQRNRSLASGSNRINRKLRSGVNVAAHKDIRFCRLIRQFVGNRTAVWPKLDLGVFQQVSPYNSLPYAEDDACAGNGHRIILIIHWCKPMILVIYTSTFLEDHTHRLTVLSQNLFRTPAVMDSNLLFRCFQNLFSAGRHLITALQTEHGHFTIATARTHSRRIDSNISAAHNNHVASQVKFLFLSGFFQELYRRINTLCVLAGHIRFPAALTADGNIESFIPLFTKLCNGNVFTNLDTAFNLYTHCLYDVDFRLNQVLFQLIGRNTVSQHSAGFVTLLENRRLITFICQEICAG